MRIAGFAWLGCALLWWSCASPTIRDDVAVVETQPPGEVVVIAESTSVADFARARGIRVEDVCAVNGLRANEQLAVGTRVFIPLLRETSVALASPSSLPPSSRPSTTTSPRPSVVPAPTSRPPPRATATTPGVGVLPAPSPTTTTDTPVVPIGELQPATGLGWLWPVDGVVVREFAPRAKTPSNGLLLAAPAGTPVRAPQRGQVAFVGNQGTLLGTFVVLDHGNAQASVYAHLAEASVRVGQQLAQGDVVGSVGSSGLVGMSPRLYFEVRQAREPVDPRPLLQAAP
jgi:lipoprotein NlpD